MRMRRAAVAGMATVVAGAGLVVVLTASGQEPAPVAVTEASDKISAILAAQRQGTKVEIASERTTDTQVFANPDGTLTMSQSVVPERVRRGAGWVDIDPTLHERPDGTVGPKAATADVSFSGGGSAVFARLSAEGKEVTLSWPRPLPKPVINGTTATYPEVLPGVDLRGNARPTGLSHELVVKTREAAANPELAKITFGLTTKGVTMKSDDAGNIRGEDGTGRALFTAPPAIMWDSSGAEGKRRQALVKVSFGKHEVSLVPDKALLADPAAQLPIVIDPVYDYHAPATAQWNLVRKKYPGNVHWNMAPEDDDAVYKGVARVGNNPDAGDDWPNWVDRSYFEFDTRRLEQSVIIDAQFKIYQGWKYWHSCVPKDTPPVELWWTSKIGSSMNWHNQATWQQELTQVQSVPKLGYCGQDWVGFNIKGKMQDAANGNWPDVTLGLKDECECGPGGWKRFFSQWHNNMHIFPRIEVTFNHWPDDPRNLQTDPHVEACHNCDGARYVGGNQIGLKGYLHDQDGGHLYGNWGVCVSGEPACRFTTHQQSSGTWFTNTLDISALDGRHVYWDMWSSDGELDTQWRPGHGKVVGPAFAVDRQSPGPAPGVSGRIYQRDQWGGGVGVADEFTFTPSGVTDVDRYKYWFTGGSPQYVDAKGLGGNATKYIAPPVDGPVTLFVQSVDKAGNESAARTEYRFFVRSGNGPKAQWTLDGNTQDTAYVGDRHGTLAGGTWGPGAVGSAVHLDGIDDHITARNTLVNSGGFSVSAWVNLQGAGPRAIVSQDGTTHPGFALWHRSDNDGANSRWSFGMAANGVPMAESAVGMPQQNTWTHLVGVYDPVAKLMRLYVNGALAGTTSQPVVPAVATGSVQIGRTIWDGRYVDPWKGGIDEVRLYDRVLSEGEIYAMVSQDNVAAGLWKFDETAGSTASNTIEGGQAMVLAGGAQFGKGAVGNALKLSGTGQHAATKDPVLRTDQSFSVAGWVQLDQAPTVNNPATAIAQEGLSVSGFFLGYRQYAEGGKWEFYASSGDGPSSGRPADTAVSSGLGAQLGTPTHLTATYNAQNKEMKLYVNGALAGTVVRANPGHVTGPLVAGRGKFNGNLGHQWNGWVDEVRVFSRALGSGEVEAFVSRDDVAVGSWRLDGDGAEEKKPELNGTLNGIPGWAAGRTSNAGDLSAHLDSKDDFVSMPRMLDTSKSFAISAWAKVDSTRFGHAVVSQENKGAPGFALTRTQDGFWAFMAASQDTSTPALDIAKSTGLAQAGAWTHLVGVYDAGEQRLLLYVNGTFAGQADHRTTVPSPGKFHIGRNTWNNAPTDYFSGMVDDVRAYQRALFAAEIRSMAGFDLNLVHNLRFDETSGDNAADSSGARGAKLNGGATFTQGRAGNSIKLDGTDDFALTQGVDLRTDGSFTVSAWVQLDKKTDQVTAVSVDGGVAGKFRLGHVTDGWSHENGAWLFEMPEQDGSVTRAAVSTLDTEIGPGRWTLLTGVYDRTAGSLWLYVDGERIGEGVLLAPWNADNAGLRVGAVKEEDGIRQYWPGRVDDVRMYTGALPTQAIKTLKNSYVDGEQGPIRKVVPADGLVGRDDSGKHYRFVGGAPILITDCAPIACGTISAVPTWRIDQLNNMNAVPVDGKTIVDETGRAFKFVGGAPIADSCLGTCSPPLKVNKSSIDTLNHMNAAPETGATAQDDRGFVYSFVGGAPFKVDDCGAVCGTPVRIRNAAIDSRDHMNSVPADRALFTVPNVPADNGFPTTVWLTVGGSRIKFDSMEELRAAGYDGGKIRQVTHEAVNQVPIGLGSGSVVRAPDSRTNPNGVFAIAAGCRVGFSSEAEFLAHYTWAQVVRIPDREMQKLPSKVCDRALVLAKDQPVDVKKRYLVIGGAAVEVNGQDLTELQRPATDTVVIPWRGLNPLTTLKIADGTLVRTPAAEQVWRIQGTERVATTEAGSVQVIPSRVLDMFPPAA